MNSFLLIVSTQISGEHLENFTVEDDWPHYLRQLNRKGTWADEVAVRATALAFDRPIYIISSLDDVNSDKNIETLTEAGNRLPPFLLGHLAEHHYWSLDVNTPAQHPANDTFITDQVQLPPMKPNDTSECEISMSSEYQLSESEDAVVSVLL